MMMMFDAILSALPQGHLHVQCSIPKKARYERSPGMANNYNDIQSRYTVYSIQLNPREVEDTVQLARFLVQYIEKVESLLHVISACQSIHLCEMG